jgi:hypothetical protein
MITATVTMVLNTGVSLRSLIETATPGQVPAPFNGRIAEVQIQWATGTFHLVFKSGTVVLATDSGFQFSTTDRLLSLRSPTWNQLSLDDIFLAGAAGGETGRITAYTI